MLRYYNFPFSPLAGMIHGRWFCSEVFRCVRVRWRCLALDNETSHICIITFRSVNIRTATANGTESTMAWGTNSSKKMLRSSIHRIHFSTQQDYIHEVPVILHDNLQRVSHRLYGPSSFTWLQLLCKQTNTGTCTILTAKRQSCTHTLSRLLPSA